MNLIRLRSGVLILSVAAASLAAMPAVQAAPTTNMPGPWRHPISITNLNPKDMHYSGQLTINVNLTHAPMQHIFYVHETIPVTPGPFTFYYPKWIPGKHISSGPVNNVAGLSVKANGKKIPWRRDTLNMYAFHVDVPPGASELNINFQYLSPFHASELGGGTSITHNIVDVEFNQVAFYPAGYYSSDITIKPTVELPDGFKFATAQQVQSREGNAIHFMPINFDEFVDSPLISGRYFNSVDLVPGAKVPVRLDIVADESKDVKVSKYEVKCLQNLITQANRLFGSHHYHHYDFLLTLSDHMDLFNLDHHQSSDIRQDAHFLTSHQLFKSDATLLPHEYAHSWNGQFRSPARLWTPSFEVPMQDNLLWVDEGETVYWAGVLATRAGLWTPPKYRKSILDIVVSMAHRKGREWRSLQDTATAAPLTYYSSGDDYIGWRRSTDFYQEGSLMWLGVDTKIRQLTHNQKSLNTFAKLFYGMDNGTDVTKTYTFQNVVDALNKVAPYNWVKFLRSQLNYTGPKLPEHALQHAGWKVVYNTTPPMSLKLHGKQAKPLDGRAVARALGFSASNKGRVVNVSWNGPAFMAGMPPGMKVVAIGGSKPFSRSALKAALQIALKDHMPVMLLVKDGSAYDHIKIKHPGKLQYAHLVRIKGTPNYLKDILTPLR